MIFIVALLISLQSLYFFGLGLPFYSVVGVLMLMLYAAVVFCLDGSARFILKPLATQVAGPLSLLILSLLAFVFQGEASFSRILGFFLMVAVPLSYSIIANRIDPLDIIRKLVLFHSSVFFIQFCLYYGFGIDFDPVALLSDVKQRGWGGSLNHEFLGAFRRLGGLYSEPGTYSTFLAPLIAVLFAARQSSLFEKCILFVGFLSLVLTFSIFAWVFCVIILSIGVLTSFRKIILILPLMPLGAWLGWPYVAYRFYDASSSKVDSGFDFREDLLVKILEYAGESWRNLLFGTGLLTEDIPFTFFGAVNDVGLLVFMQLSSGILGVLFIVAIVFHANWRFGFAGLGVVAIVLSSKVSVFSPMFWLNLALCCHAGIVQSRRYRVKAAAEIG